MLIELWDEFDSFGDEYEEEQANMALMDNTEASESKSESNSYSKKVFSHLTHYELELSLAGILENSQRL